MGRVLLLLARPCALFAMVRIALARSVMPSCGSPTMFARRDASPDAQLSRAGRRPGGEGNSVLVPRAVKRVAFALKT